MWCSCLLTVAGNCYRTGPVWHIYIYITQTLHVCHICLHWGSFGNQCRHIEVKCVGQFMSIPWAYPIYPITSNNGWWRGLVAGRHPSLKWWCSCLPTTGFLSDSHPINSQLSLNPCRSAGHRSESRPKSHTKKNPPLAACAMGVLLAILFSRACACA